jgi:hypothetical protein
MDFGGSQDKNDMGRRFFKSLEQGVRGFLSQHMNLIYNIDLVTSLVGSIIDPLTEVSDFIDTPIAGSINLNHIQSPAFGYCLAHGASIARFTLAIGETIHRLGQNASGTGLTCASWTVEKIGVRHTTTTESITQCLRYWLLPHYLSQGLGTPLTIKNLTSHLLLVLLYSILSTFQKGFPVNNC